jgi:hypothetical protein
MTAPNTPNSASSDEQNRARAAQRIKERNDFRWHLITYLVINGMMWVIWAVVHGVHSYPWPIWLTLFWGIGLAFHWGYVTRRTTSPEEIDAELGRMRKR